MEQAAGRIRLDGVKFFEPLRGAMEQLRAQKAHPNRNLHLDDYLCLLLLAYFNPAITSLRVLRAVEKSGSQAQARQIRGAGAGRKFDA